MKIPRVVTESNKTGTSHQNTRCFVLLGGVSCDQFADFGMMDDDVCPTVESMQHFSSDYESRVTFYRVNLTAKYNIHKITLIRWRI